MSSIVEIQKSLLDQVVAGEFIQGMHDYYADDAIQEEASGARIEGKANIIANEEAFSENVKAYHGCTVKSIAGHDDGQGNGITFAEYAMKFDLQDGSTFNPEQVQVTRWESGKVKRITFYYDPAKL